MEKSDKSAQIADRRRFNVYFYPLQTKNRRWIDPNWSVVDQISRRV